MKNSNIDDVIVRGIVSIVKDEGQWMGTMSRLTTALVRVLSKRQREMLPASPSALRVSVNEVTNRLRNRGVSVRFARATDHTRTRYVKFVY